MGEYHAVSVKSLATSAGCYFLMVCYPFSICGLKDFVVIL